MPPKAFLGDEAAADRTGIHPLDFMLARIIGCTVAELHDRMSMREWVYWSRFLRVEAQTQELADRTAAARFGG